jgi:hypothetical protein
MDNDFWKAAAIRALRSFAQGLVTLGGLNLTDLLSARWYSVVVAAAGYALMSVLTSVVTGIPEAPREDETGTTPRPPHIG